jgi:C-terminal processing protease CtpA/Prc
MKKALLCVVLIAVVVPALCQDPVPAEPKLLSLKVQDLPLAKALRYGITPGVPAVAPAEEFGDALISLWVRQVPADRYLRVLTEAVEGGSLDLEDLKGFDRLIVDGRNLLADAWEDGELSLTEADPLTLEYYRHRRALAERELSGGTYGGTGWLGVRLAGKATRNLDSLPPETHAALEAWDGWGAFVGEILPDTPAAATGLRPGDVVVRINEFWVDSSCTLRRLVSRAQPGTEIQLEVLRDGIVQLEWATLTQRPTD